MHYFDHEQLDVYKAAIVAMLTKVTHVVSQAHEVKNVSFSPPRGTTLHDTGGDTPRANLLLQK